MKKVLSLAILCLMVAPVNAAVIDGSVAGDAYGSALAVQMNETSFGDNQSELNAGYGIIEGGKLNFVLTGQVENNFNKLEIWIDAAAGGQSVFSSAGNDGAGAMDGLVFDTAFTPETHIILRNGNFGGDRFDVDFANLLTTSVTSQSDVFGGSLTGAGTVAAGPANASSIGIGYDNSNILGVGGAFPGTPAAGVAEAVQTGVELSIDLNDLGWVGGDIRVSAVINSGDHTFASNQVLGSLPTDAGHLGGLSSVDFSNIDGDQFFTVAVPEPTTMLLAGLASIGVMTMRRRS